MHCCWFEAVWAEQVTRQSNYTCSRLYFGHYHLPPYSCTVLYFVFYGYYPLPELPEVAPMYYKYFVFVLFFVFWALSPLSAELHSCSKFSTHSKSKCSSSAMQWGRGGIQFAQIIATNTESSFKIWLRISKRWRRMDFQDFLDVELKLCESYIRHIHRYPVKRGNIGSRQAFLY